MNSFHRFFGPKAHLSASQINDWIAGPGIWARKYIAGQKEDGPWFWRGSAIENGLSALLQGVALDDAISVAHNSFTLNSADYKGDDLKDENQLITPILTELAKWQAPSDLNATQIRIEHWIDPIPVPFVGFIDFAFDGIDIDLKTTKALPSSPRADNIRQGAIYRAARKRRGGLLYVTPKKHAFYEITDDMMADALLEVEAAALSLNNFLARMDTREDILRSLPIDWDHWKAPKSKVPLSDLLLGG